MRARVCRAPPHPLPPLPASWRMHKNDKQRFCCFIFRCINNCFQGGLKGCVVCVLGSLPYSVADPGLTSRIRLFSIWDPGSQIWVFFHPGSRIRIKEFKYFNPKQWFLSSRKYDPGCSSRIRIPDPDFLPIPDPGVKKAPDPGSRIPDPDPQHCYHISW